MGDTYEILVMDGSRKAQSGSRGSQLQAMQFADELSSLYGGTGYSVQVWIHSVTGKRTHIVTFTNGTITFRNAECVA